jgi:acyl-CoA oxidase
VINCPTTMSHKYWITNGACHANYAIVFAQTIVNNKNEGINAFIVQIRQKSMKHCQKMEEMETCPGVYIEDMGYKIGLNGVDNGKLVFSNVRIPRWALLNKLCQVSADGVFQSEIKKVSERFFNVADRLLSGRLCIASMSIGNARYQISSSIKYCQQRLAVGPTGESDTPIMSYQLNQNALLPLVARTIVLNFGLNAGKNLFRDHVLTADKSIKHKVIKTLCVIKTMVSW